MLGKKDSGLSEGQMQRLAVARGLFQWLVAFCGTVSQRKTVPQIG